MKKTLPYILIALFVLLLWDMSDAGMHLNVDGEEFDGPFGALLGILLAGGGTLLGLLVMLVVGVVVAVVFAGLGVILLGALGLGAVSLAVLVSPLLLPLLLPLALVWYLVSRSRKTRMSKPAAEPAAA